jgi:hypothetical protein
MTTEGIETLATAFVPEKKEASIFALQKSRHQMSEYVLSDMSR